MQKKKLLIGTLLTLLIAGGTYAYSDGGLLKGSFPSNLKPDLTISSIANVDDMLTIVMKNSGPGNVAAGKAGQTYVYVDDLTVPTKTYNWTTLSDKAFFAAGASSTLEHGSLAEGLHEVMVCIDATSLVPEVNEGNNCLTETVEFIAPLPDLIPDLSPTSYSISGEVGLDATGTVIDLDIVMDLQCGIENIGTGTASGMSYSNCVFLQSPSYSVGAAYLVDTISLAPSTTTTYTKSYPVTDISFINFLQEIYDTGTYTLTVEHKTDYARSSFVIEESDETNNTATETINVDASGITWVTR